MGISTVRRCAVFLDRDGVLNDAVVIDGKPYPPASVDELVVAGDAATATSLLRSAGFALIMVTNQPDVARGLTSRKVVDAINDHLSRLLSLDEVRVCFHDDDDECDCRKPRPGLLLAAPHYDLSCSFMVGDRWRDIEAGQRAGCRTVFIDRGYAEQRPVADTVVSTLSDAVNWILEKHGSYDA
jgi:D-glycero-D-manno-heptose 1,7-bisphosphate phosphatase